MDGPGMSLFQGAASIHINNSAQDRLEEQEELEDQKRRNEELKHKLANAFDDLLDDDEASSVNSSGNYTLDAPNNGIACLQTRTGLPPTYVESLTHLKESQHGSESPKIFNETPKNHVSHLRHTEEPINMQFSPYGAGDGQNLYYEQDYRGHMNGVNTHDRQEYMNSEQLKVLLEIRIKECQHLASQMQNLETEIDSLRARLTAAVNDKDKAELSLQEAHHLLASSKHKLIELEQQVASLREKLVESDQEKEQLKLELRSAAVSLQDVQQRLHTLQVTHTHDTDALFREQQDRHRDEIDRLQDELTKAKGRLDERDNEIKALERRCMEKDREKEEVLIEKGATINRLANELEAAQSRLGGGEVARLREKVAQVAGERSTAREQVRELGAKLELTAHDLVLYRNKLSASQKECEQWRCAAHQLVAEALPERAAGASPPAPGALAPLKEVLSRYRVESEKLSTLQEELTKRDKKLEQYRKLESELRTRLEEQKGVEMQLNSRMAVLQNKLDLLGSDSHSDLLDSYKHQNERLLAELSDARAELKSLELKYTELEMEYDKMKCERGSRASIVQEANADLLRELERYSGQLKDALRESGELKTLYLQACSARDAVSRELHDVRSRVQQEKETFRSQEKEYVERLEKQKQQIDRLTSDLTNSREELERANKRISELQREFTDKQKEFTEKLDKYLEDEKSALRKEREPCAQCEKHVKQIRHLDEQLSKCTIKLASQDSNETLMKELKGKAEFFQQYIVDRFKKLTELRSVATSTDEARSPPTAGAERRASDHALTAETALMMKEKAIREQIAEKFTLEMKTVEMNCARRIKEIENEHLEAITKLKELLERKAKEVDTLKEFIISERAKVTQILESKENEISILIKEHNQLQVECQRAKDVVTEWRMKAERYKEKASRLSSVEDALKSEREDWLRKAGSTNKEYMAAKSKVGELQARVLALEQQYEKLHSEHKTLQEKYKNAKKTIFTYKDYVAKKDAHVSNELNRIQDEYRKIFVKLQNQINHHISCRTQEERGVGAAGGDGARRACEYSEKINKLSEDISKLAQTSFHNGPDLK